jgi:hypothetical protein
MAKQEVVIEVDIQGTPKVESMRTQMRKLREELATLPEGTAEFNRVQRQLGELKDRMDDLGKSVNTVSGAPLERLNNSFSMIGSSIMSLDFDNAITGLKGVGGALQDFKVSDLTNAIKGFGSALGAIGKALLTNPIFLIAGSIALIATNMDKVFKAIPSFENALKGISQVERDIAAAVEARAAASKKAYDQSALEVNAMKLQGKTEKEIVQYRLTRLQTSIADAKVQLETAVQQRDSQIAAAKRNREILEGVLKFLQAPLYLLLKSIDTIANAIPGINTNLAEGLVDLTASFIVDPAEVEKNLDENISKQRDAIKQMESDYAGYQIQLREMDKVTAAKKAEETVKRADEEITFIKSKDATQLKSSADNTKLIIDAQHQLKMQAIALEIAMEDEKRRKIYEGEKALNEQKYELAKAAIDGMMSLNELLTSAGILNAEQSFKVGKSLQLAQATISAITGTQNAFTTASASPITTAFPGYPFVMAGIAAAAGAANIAKIASMRFNKNGGSSPAPTAPSGGGGGGMGGGSTNAPALDLSFINGQTNQPQPLQTYVLATNVSSAQEAEQKIKDQSRIIK